MLILFVGICVGWSHFVVRKRWSGLLVKRRWMLFGLNMLLTSSLLTSK